MQQPWVTLLKVEERTKRIQPPGNPGVIYGTTADFYLAGAGANLPRIVLKVQRLKNTELHGPLSHRTRSGLGRHLRHRSRLPPKY
jgi:hypothetical protein